MSDIVEVNNPMGFLDNLLNAKGIRWSKDPTTNKYYLDRGDGIGPVEVSAETAINSNGQELKWTGIETFRDGIELHIKDDAVERIGNPVYVGPLKQQRPSSTTLRWPQDSINTGTDYVYFQFGKYTPPFGADEEALRKKMEDAEDEANSGYLPGTLKNTEIETDARMAYKMYGQQGVLNPDDPDSVGFDIMLPMPQDLSNEVQAQWQGKQFTATGRAATAALAAGNFSYASNLVNNIAGSAKALQNALNTTVLNAIPGVGGNLDFNDISGSTRGIVINPNAELLYDSPEMRELGMIFKMVPRNAEESAIIRRICSVFRKASLPRWAAKGRVSLFDNDKNIINKDGNAGSAKGNVDLSSEGNWIRVPNLCKFTFMHGSEPHPYIYQFKPCAIQAVEVNYTPDGTFATYEDGAPVAVELRLNFMETKLIFADEINIDPGLSV